MTATDLAVRDPQAAVIPAKLAYARALAESGLLPASYRKNPANVLWAMEYGDMLGLAPMATMTGVHVIEGKPTASAGLISALVRQAGHKLRVDGDNKSATCVITRSDDPKPFSVTWTLKKDGSNPSAEEAKLLSKPVWQQYPASMLKSRAITQCARDACEEVLFGLHYTPEELGAEVTEDGELVTVPSERVDIPAQVPSSPEAVDWEAAITNASGNYDLLRALWTRAEKLAAPQDVLDRIKALGVAAKPAETPAEATEGAPSTEEVLEGEIVDEPVTESPERPSKKQLQYLHIALGEHGLTQRDDRLTVVASIVDHPVTTTGELTVDEVKLVIRKLDEWAEDAPLVIQNILETESQPAVA